MQAPACLNAPPCMHACRSDTKRSKTGRPCSPCPRQCSAFRSSGRRPRSAKGLQRVALAPHGPDDCEDRANNDRQGRGQQGARNQYEEDRNRKHPGHLQTWRHGLWQPLPEVQNHHGVVVDARGKARQDQCREADLCQVLQMNRHTGRYEEDVEQRHDQVHRVVEEVLENLLVDETAPGSPEVTAPVAELVGDGGPVHDQVHREHDGRDEPPPQHAGLVSHAREDPEDGAARVEAHPVAWDEDQAVAEKAHPREVARAVAGLVDPPSAEQLGDRLHLREHLEGAKALAGALALRTVRRPPRVEVDKGRHEDPELGGDEDVQPLNAGVVRGAEDNSHVDKDREVPQGPHEAEHRPEQDEQRLAVRQAVRLHGARVVEAAEEGKGTPAAAVHESQQQGLDRAPVRAETDVLRRVHRQTRAVQLDRVALDDHGDEDGPHVVQDPVFGGRLPGELPHLAEAVKLHHRLGAVGALRRRGQGPLVDLAVGQPRELLQSFEHMRHHVGH
mmetsp:Transcript_89224/g.266137  ORF Transcript_89224/g.266137 Transcript_89224/m.266137 type:complete len:502 (-) Transcript_89224:2343-3848(-)